MIDDRVKIMMLKGEKGDEYDDTELRAEINAKLANTPYIGYTEDGTFELPIHTINDSVTGASSTWSSNKINDKASKVVYTVDIEGYDGSTDPYYTTATCGTTYAEALEMIANNTYKPEAYSHYSTSSEYDHNEADNYDVIESEYSRSFIRIKINSWNDRKITILHYDDDEIVVTINLNEDYSGEIADLQESNTELQAKKWISLGVVGNDGVEIPFTTSATSTILVMTCSATAQDGNSLFLCRKSMAGSSGWKLSDLGLDVNCTIHSSGSYIYVHPDDDIGNIAVYYQVIE